MSVIGRTQLLVKSKNRLRCRFRWFVLTKKLAAAGASVRSNATCATRPSHRWGRSRRTWRATRASSRSRARSAARPSPSSSGSSSTCASTAARSPTPAPTAVTRSLIRSAVFLSARNCANWTCGWWWFHTIRWAYLNTNECNWTFERTAGWTANIYRPNRLEGHWFVQFIVCQGQGRLWNKENGWKRPTALSLSIISFSQARNSPAAVSCCSTNAPTPVNDREFHHGLLSFNKEE